MSENEIIIQKENKGIFVERFNNKKAVKKLQFNGRFLLSKNKNIIDNDIILEAFNDLLLG